MAVHTTSRTLLAAILIAAPLCVAQTPPQTLPAAPCPASNQNPSQGTDKNSPQPCPPPAANAKKPSPAEEFPFPGEPAKPANPPAATDSPTPTATPSSAAAEHPFPTTPPPKLPGGDSSSSSSSSSDDPNAVPDDNPAATSKGDPPEGTSVHRKLPKVQRVQTDDERVDEDLKVATFYMRDENLPGAYLRAKDAVKVQPDYSLTHFTLAQIAQKMKKKDEAIAEFQTYLKLDPNGEKAKVAQKALDELQ